MSVETAGDMVSEDRKKGVRKFDKLFTNTFHRRLIVITVLSCTICFPLLFFSTNEGKTHLKKIRNNILKVVIKAQHECEIIEYSAITSTTNTNLLFKYKL
jgi:hypothetical protein